MSHKELFASRLFGVHCNKPPIDISKSKLKNPSGQAIDFTPEFHTSISKVPPPQYKSLDLLKRTYPSFLPYTATTIFIPPVS